jgi:hypothetical protein
MIRRCRCGAIGSSKWACKKCGSPHPMLHCHDRAHQNHTFLERTPLGYQGERLERTQDCMHVHPYDTITHLNQPPHPTTGPTPEAEEPKMAKSVADAFGRTRTERVNQLLEYSIGCEEKVAEVLRVVYDNSNHGDLEISEALALAQVHCSMMLNNSLQALVYATLPPDGEDTA